MADTAVDTGTTTLVMDRVGLSGPFWISDQIGVVIFLDSGGDVSARKTTDGGATRATKQVLENSDCRQMCCWFDRETPGDTGTKVHVTYLDYSIDWEYAAYDIDAGSWGSVIEITSPIAIQSTSGNNKLAMCKLENGDLIATTQVGSSNYTSASDDDGATWGAWAGVALRETYPEYAMLYPAQTGDAADACAIFQDGTANELSIKMYDDSADSWTETSISTGFNFYTNSKIMDCAVRHSDGHILVACLDDSADADLKFYDINPNSIASPGVTTKTNVATGIGADVYDVGICIDQNTDDVYVVRTDSTATSGERNVVYKKSDDGGSTWGSEETYSEETATNFRFASAGRTISTDGGRFQPVFRDATLFDIFVNLTNDIEVKTILLGQNAGFLGF